MIRWRWAAVAVLGAVALALGAWASRTSAASPGELTLSGPTTEQTTDKPFDVTLSVTRAEQTWAVYNAHIAYDNNVLEVKDVQRLPLADCNDQSWGVAETKPTVLVACVFQESTETGPATRITFQCLRDGRSELHLITMDEDSIQGSSLLDVNALTIPTDLVDGPTITCGAGGPLATVPIPTNPPQSAVDTAIAGGVPTQPPANTGGGVPAEAATKAASVPGAGSTVAAAETASAQGTPIPEDVIRNVIAPVRTSTAAAEARRAGSDGSGGGSNTGLIVGIVVAVAVVAAAGVGGGLWWIRRRSTV